MGLLAWQGVRSASRVLFLGELSARTNRDHFKPPAPRGWKGSDTGGCPSSPPAPAQLSEVLIPRVSSLQVPVSLKFSLNSVDKGGS